MSHIKCQARLTNRRGASAVEAAIILPVVIVITLGGIDFAQYINLGQLVSNASREAARIAGRSTTSSVEEVEDAVENYLQAWYPTATDEGFGNRLSISVKTEEEDKLDQDNDRDDTELVEVEIPSGDLSRVESGTTLRIVVSFDYENVRWIPGPDYWSNNLQTVTTYCRRE